MTRWTNRVGDRLLAAIAPKVEASAVNCQIRSVGGGCFRRCCYESGAWRCGGIFC